MLKALRVPTGGEAGIALTLVAVVALIILPLPPHVIDVLLSINICISITLLMTTMYAKGPAALTSFPSLLLFTTLYRLSLNIASTKSILLNADAGTIIASFGRLVVGGNLVVGIVVFAIITIVQFIVIAKGADRVAEVGARFTLDGLPGKQMSIDADLRANILTPEEARNKRAQLAIESALHGGMDGAMKFVKGDAIAGLLITVVTIVAGIAVGILYHGMTVGDAATRFAVLSVGDAMVSQLPSLMISIGAGIIITRISDESRAPAGEPRSLGEDIHRQIGDNPRALAFAALLVAFFAAVPGFPWPLFLILSGLLAFGSYKAALPGRGGRAAGNNGSALRRAGSRSEEQPIQPRAPQFTCAIGVRLAMDLASGLSSNRLQAAFERGRAGLQEDLGLPFPGITMWSTDALQPLTYEIMMLDVPVSKVMLPADKLLVPAAEEDPALSRLCEERGPAAGLRRTWWAAVRDLPAGTATWTIEEVIAKESIDILRRSASVFVGIQETQWVLDQLNLEFPGLVTEVQKALSPQRIAEVLRRLLEEGISIRNARGIMESLVIWGPKEKDLLMLTEYVRCDMGRYIAYLAAGAGNTLPAILLDASLEQYMRQAIKQTPTGNFLALSPEESDILVERIRNHAIADGEPIAGVAVVASMDIRRYVRRLVETKLRWLPVYSYQELDGRLELRPLGRVAM